MVISALRMLSLYMCFNAKPYPFMKPHILFYSNGLGIWHGFSKKYITHIKVNNGSKSPILNLSELQFFRTYPSLKPYILCYGICI